MEIQDNEIFELFDFAVRVKVCVEDDNNGISSTDKINFIKRVLENKQKVLRYVEYKRDSLLGITSIKVDDINLCNQIFHHQQTQLEMLDHIQQWWIKICPLLKKKKSDLWKPISVENTKKRRRESYKLQKEESKKKVKYNPPALFSGNNIIFNQSVLDAVEPDVLPGDTDFSQIISWVDPSTRNNLRLVCKAFLGLVHSLESIWGLDKNPSFTLGVEGVNCTWLKNNLVYSMYNPSLATNDRNNHLKLFTDIRRRERHNETLQHSAYVVKNTVKNNEILFKELIPRTDLSCFRNISLQIDIYAAMKKVEIMKNTFTSSSSSSSSNISTNTNISFLQCIHSIHIDESNYRRDKRGSIALHLQEFLQSCSNLTEITGQIDFFLAYGQDLIPQKTVKTIKTCSRIRINHDILNYYPNLEQIEIMLPMTFIPSVGPSQQQSTSCGAIININDSKLTTEWLNVWIDILESGIIAEIYSLIEIVRNKGIKVLIVDDIHNKIVSFQ